MLYLSKIITVFVTPLGVCLAIALLGLALLARGARRAGMAAALAAVLGLWIAAMPLTGRLALGVLEARYPALTAAESPMADVAILLGGAVSGPAPPRPGADLGEAADRVLFAAELFKAGKVRKIVVSGGNLPWGADSQPEAESIRALLVSWGVPDADIIAAGQSRTTAENAREVAALWPSLDAASALLVTSGAHMPRALAAFRKAGLPVAPAATDIRVAQQPVDILDLLPQADGLQMTSDAVKEFIGYFVYWLRGDI